MKKIVTKKKVVIPLLCILLLVLGVLLTYDLVYNSDIFSQNNQEFPANIDPALALKIRQDYLKMIKPPFLQRGFFNLKLRDISISRYFDNYSGCEVIRIIYRGAPNNTDMGQVESAGYTLLGADRVCAYKDSQFYSLKEAYAKRLITKADVYEIGKKVDPSFLERYPEP